jgi:hypothetical protein
MKMLDNADTRSIGSVLPSAGVAVGLDGSMDYDEVLEMLLFYVAAAGYQCKFETHDGVPVFDLQNAKRTEELTLSTAVPLWREDLLNVAETTIPIETELDFRSNLERIPFALMTMSELSLALSILRAGSASIIFLDRPFSATYPSLYHNVGFLTKPYSRKSALEGVKTSNGLVTKLDILLASIIGPGSFYVPRRGGFLPYAGIQVLLNGAMSKSGLAERLELRHGEINELLTGLRRINEREGVSGHLLAEDDVGTVSLQKDIERFWSRIEELTLNLTDRIFNPSPDITHPLAVNGKWLTVVDLNILTLFLLQLVMHESHNRNVLVIGVAKDTTSTDFTRSALPLAISRSHAQVRDLPSLKNDKALLTILSTVNSHTMSTPWRTFSYDAANTTMVVNSKGQPIAARQTISRELFFIREYFQLRTFTSDPEIRGPVFLFDRPYNPKFDSAYVAEYEGYERGKPTKLRLFMESDFKRSALDDVCLLILSKSDNPEVLEAYGHNQLLYLADKFVKQEVQLNKNMLRGVVDLELTPLARKQKVFSIARRFRDLRAESESARKASVGRRDEGHR